MLDRKLDITVKGLLKNSDHWLQKKKPAAGSFLLAPEDEGLQNNS